MIFQENLELTPHPELRDKHALFSPSQHNWIDYDEAKLLTFYDNRDAQVVGTQAHVYAAELIRMHYWFLEHNLPSPISLRRKDSVSLHVMHSINHWLQPEVPVKYSDICFGTSDALGFHLPTKTLRINDLKTGRLPGDMRQLEQYAAIFFAEYAPILQYKYMIDINECKVELRIFQYDDITLVEPPIDYIIGEVLAKARHQHEVLSEALARRGQ